MELNYKYFSSPLGDVEISFDDAFIYSVHIMDEGASRKKQFEGKSEIANAAEQQFRKYFDGTLKQFDLPVKFIGTEFQQKVWSELLRIPFGETISYLQLAKNLGDEKCIRAAASANGKNPFWVTVPCHRVIGTNGSLTGYAGGIWRKQWLLDHEAKLVGNYQKLF